MGNSSKQPYLNAFKSILREQIKPLMQEITGIALNDDIDLFCGQYATTDYLLCHDDELEGARIAVMRIVIFRRNKPNNFCDVWQYISNPEIIRWSYALSQLECL